jgi:protein ImuA
MTSRIDLAQLKRRIACVPALHTRSHIAGHLSVGIPAIDTYLWNAAVPLGALHEISGLGVDEEQGATGAAFLALSLKANAASGWIAWVTQAADLYAPGLAAFGLDLRQLILVSVRRDADVCWALEEALHSRSLSAVAGEVGLLTLTATRRLQLAAEQAGIPCFLLRRWRTKDLAEQQRVQPIAAATRWRIAPEMSDGDLTLAPELGRTRRRLDLWRCRNAAAASWIMEFDHADEYRASAVPVAVAAALGDRSISAAAQSQSAAKPETAPATATLLRFG